jgi:hypothetical protein
MDPDPYSTAIADALAAIRKGIAQEGEMSNTEHANLIAIEELIRVRDNH